MAPPLFWSSCSKVKNDTNKHADKCLTWWKIVHQIASFKPILKKLQLLRRAHPPVRHPPALRKRDGRRCRAIFTSKNLPPPPLWKSFRRLWAPSGYLKSFVLSFLFFLFFFFCFSFLFFIFIFCCLSRGPLMLRGPWTLSTHATQSLRHWMRFRSYAILEVWS